MMKHRFWPISLLLALAGCDSGTPAPTAAQDKEPPAAFPAGEYEVSAVTESLRSTDRADSKAAPATIHKLGAPEVRKICSPAGPKPSSDLFAEPGDTCTMTADYARNGRLNMSFECVRPGGRGPLTVTLDGKYDDQSFEVEVVTGTRFNGPGDYVLSQRLKGKRLGNCPASARAPG